MKKFFASVVGLTLLCTPLSAAVRAADTQPITVYIDGQKVNFEVDPITEKDRTLVPMRAVFENLGAMVTWNEETQTATAVRGNITISFTIDNQTMMKNGMPVTLDVPARKLNDRTRIPLRAVSEALSCRVDWNESTQKVSISTMPDSYHPDDETNQYTIVRGIAEHPTLISDAGGEWTIALPNDWMPDLEEEGNIIYTKFLEGGTHTLYVQIRDAGGMTDEAFSEEIKTAAKSRIDLLKISGSNVLSTSGPENITVNKTSYTKTSIQWQFSDKSIDCYETTYYLLHSVKIFQIGYTAPTADTSVIDKVIADSIFK